MSRALAVLFLTAWYPAPWRPGAGVFVVEQARAVARYDRVAVLHCAGLNTGLARPWRFEEEREPSFTRGLPVYRVQHRLSPVPKTSYVLHLWSVWQACRRIVQSGFRPDVIHAHTYEAALPGLLIARLIGVPLVVTEHFSAFMTGTITRRALAAARWTFPRANRVVAVSQALQDALQSRGVRGCFAVVPNAVDTDLFYFEPVPDNAGAPRRIVFVGSLVPIKDVPTVLTAAARLANVRKDWRLDIVGDGPDRIACEARAAGLGLTDLITFHGALPAGQVAELVRGAHCLVLSSRTETFSLAIAEALCAGTPVVATRCGGPEEMVNAENGILVPPADAGALAGGLAAVLENGERYQRPSIAAQAAARFAPERVGAQLDALYREAIADQQTRRPQLQEHGR